MNNRPKFNGFTRVMVNDDWEAWTPKRAVDAGIIPEVGFMRDDGWTLGAPIELEHHAFRCWSKQWTHFIRFPDTEWTPIEQYRGNK